MRYASELCVCFMFSLQKEWNQSFFYFCIAIYKYISVTVVQSSRRVQLFTSLWTAALQATLSLTIFWSLPKFMCTESVMPSSHLIFWCPLLLLPSVFPRIRVFSNESAVCIRWPKYWNFSFSISPSNKYWNIYVYMIYNVYYTYAIVPMYIYIHFIILNLSLFVTIIKAIFVLF